MKRPLAYVTAAWRGGECEVMEQAAKYCRTLPHQLREFEHKLLAVPFLRLRAFTMIGGIYGGKQKPKNPG